MISRKDIIKYNVAALADKDPFGINEVPNLIRFGLLPNYTGIISSLFMNVTLAHISGETSIKKQYFGGTVRTKYFQNSNLTATQWACFRTHSHTSQRQPGDVITEIDDNAPLAHQITTLCEALNEIVHARSFSDSDSRQLIPSPIEMGDEQEISHFEYDQEKHIFRYTRNYEGESLHVCRRIN